MLLICRLIEYSTVSSELTQVGFSAHSPRE